MMRGLMMTGSAAVLLGIAGCGQLTGPSKADIKQVIQARMEQANGKVAANTLGIFSGPYDVSDFDVTNADCSAKDNGIYSCAVTSINKNTSKTAQLSFKRVNGGWALVE